ncbi:MAG: Gfo/Idh/MocA family oxidoreductase [Trueperaceae bacterium]|nr:Gfo/Idh/MocA family oxidoreductase [Trueperaceae bacterium]
MTIFRWGILGAGSIAHKFAKGLNDLPDTELYAVGSRSQAKADAFADVYQIPQRYDSYEALVADPKLDAIYVATPHTFHKEHSILAMSQGKAVLCEKPFALNAAEAAEMIAFSRNHKVFLMEAMWSRFLPHMQKVKELINEGAIGELRMLQADFGFRMPEVMPEHRLFNPHLGGGALLDVGIYPISLAYFLFGKPKQIKTVANLGSTSVDEEAVMLFQHEGGQLSLLSTAIRLNTPHEALLVGTEGQIRIHSSWWAPTTFTLEQKSKKAQLIEVDTPLNGYNYEALEVARCVQEGRLESETMPLDETLDIMKTLDSIRKEWGLSYPAEAK